VLGLTCVIAAVMIKAGFPAWISALTAIGPGFGLGAINGLLLTRLRLPHPFIPRWA
jgi:ribose transport system permease protein